MVNDENQFLQSQFYEQLVEHVFISELLQEAWFGFDKTVEVLRSEIDAAGYDLVLECGGVVRHVQLKTSQDGSRAGRQKINKKLEQKPGGCVIWIVRNVDRTSKRMSLQYRFFGGGPGQPLPSLSRFHIAKHTKGNAQGVKLERPGIRLVPRSKFDNVPNTTALITRLFGLREPTRPSA